MALIGLTVVLAALWRDEPVTPRGAAGVGPAWTGLPEPSDLARVEFPLAFPGYDPASVEVTYEAVVRAYEDLWAVTPQDVRQRARSRVATREGRPAGQDAPVDLSPPAATVPAPPELGEAEAEALGAEAALGILEQRRAGEAERHDGAGEHG